MCPKCGKATTLDKLGQCCSPPDFTDAQKQHLMQLLDKKVERKYMDIYLLECWTHELYPGPDGDSHDTYVVGIFSSREKALEYAKSNPTYAGNKDNWDWVITLYALDKNNEYCGIPVHYTRHGGLVEDPASYTPDMEDDEEDDDLDPADLDNTDPEEDPVIVKDGTISVSQPVNTQEDIDEFIERLQKLKPNLPLRQEPDQQELLMKVIDAVADLARSLKSNNKNV